MENPTFAIISVFSDKLSHFKGNTSAVVLLSEKWKDEQMQHLARDFNQPATTFLTPGKNKNHYFVRWFAPDAEIGLCGHGSMAAIAFLSREFNIKETTIQYSNGEIIGRILGKDIGSITLKAITSLFETNIPESLPEALGVPIQAYYKTADKDVVLIESESLIKSMLPDFSLLKKLKPFGYIATASGDQVDFVSRTFIPHVQQLEDPATGSSHAVLVPFWSKRLNKTNLIAHQLSKRGGKFACEIHNDKVDLSGNFNFIAEGGIIKNYEIRIRN